jgi:hypothetical protein
MKIAENIILEAAMLLSPTLHAVLMFSMTYLRGRMSA